MCFRRTKYDLRTDLLHCYLKTYNAKKLSRSLTETTQNIKNYHQITMREHGMRKIGN